MSELEKSTAMVVINGAPYPVDVPSLGGAAALKTPIADIFSQVAHIHTYFNEELENLASHKDYMLRVGVPTTISTPSSGDVFITDTSRYWGWVKPIQARTGLQSFFFPASLPPLILRAKNDFIDAFESEPFERGVPHKCEAILKSLAISAEGNFMECLQQILADDDCQDILPDLLECIGRLPLDQIGENFLQVMNDYLNSENYLIRDGAIQGLQHWLPNTSIGMLFSERVRIEQDQYLRDYLSRLVLQNDVRYRFRNYAA